MAARATIVITTRNRRDDLRRALQSAAAQTVEVELLVVDDASTDGTSDMVVAEFPSARLHRNDAPTGYIDARNLAARLATAPIVVSIDDDAVLASPATVEQTLRDFDHPRIGAVAIPFVDVARSPAVQHAAPERERRWLATTFRGTAHALRRDVFLELGGYRSSLLHQTEEPDYCLRMLDAGYVTRLGRADPIEHHESPKRDAARQIALGRRNDLLHGWHNVPLPYLPVRLLKVTLHSVLFAVELRQARAVVRGVVDGWTAGLRRKVPREPVTRATYRLDHRMRKRGPLTLDEVEPQLPPIEPAGPSPARIGVLERG